MQGQWEWAVEDASPYGSVSGTIFCEKGAAGMQKVNYQKMLEGIIKKHEEKGEVPTLLLHSCCAPCSSYVLEYLSQYFKITVFYYNPNIYPREEYDKRVAELQRLIAQMPMKNPVTFVERGYDEGEFFQAVKGFENIPEGGERCFRCYRLRLERTAQLAKELGVDYLPQRCLFHHTRMLRSSTRYRRSLGRYMM